MMDDLLKFVEARIKGASKIAKQSEAKGGPSKLTAWHYEAKIPEYDEIVSMIRAGKTKYDIKEHCRKKFRTLAGTMTSPSISQKEFQQQAGRAEVFGEVYNKL